MDSSSRELMQTDSEETQPPKVPLEGFTPVQESAPVQDSTPVQSSVPKRLDPSTEMWFGHRDVSHAIAENIQTHYKQAFTCWRYGPSDHKRFWWNCFKTQFTWDPQLDAEVKMQWQKLASKRLKDMVAKAAKEPMDKLITWMSDDIRRSLKRMRETDEEFKKRSQRNRRNKVEGPKAKIGHTQGSISSTMWFNKLAKALKRRPSASELFAATHSKVDESGQRKWCDEHARSVYEKYEQLKAGKDVQVGSEADDHIFYEACGGWSNKGSIYGLGRAGPSLFPRAARPRGSTAAASSSYSSPVVTQLQDKLQSTQIELQTTQARLHSTEEELRSTKEQLHTAMKQLEDQRVGLLELHARFDSFSALLGHPTTRGGNSLDSS